MPERQDRKGGGPARVEDDDPLTLDPGARKSPARDRAGAEPASASVPGARRTSPAAARRAMPSAAARASSAGGNGAAERIARAWGRHPLLAFFRHGRRLAFYRQLLALVKAGVGLPAALGDLVRYAPDPRTARALEAVQQELAHGSGLAEAMAKHGALFDDGIVELLAFAEETGQLERVLNAAIEYLQKQQRLRWLAVFAGLWPAYLLLGFVVAGPGFDAVAAVQAGGGGSAAWAAYGHGVVRNLLVGTASATAAFLLPIALALLGLDATWERLKMSLPLAGRVFRAAAASRFFLALGLAMSSGVEIIRAIGISLRASGSPAIAARANVAQSRIRAGGTLAESLEKIGVFPREQLGAIAIAEKTGTLDTALEELARDSQQTVVNGTRVLIVVAMLLTASLVIVLILRPLLGTLFGPIWDYYHLADKIPDT